VVITIFVPTAWIAPMIAFDLLRRRRIEIRRRLIEEEHLGAQRPSTSKGKALLLATREHARRMIGETQQTDALERSTSAQHRSCRGRPAAFSA
jgi:hypothetical protein